MKNPNTDPDTSGQSFFSRSPTQEIWEHIEKLRYEFGLEKEAWACLLQLSISDYESMRHAHKSPKLSSVIHLCLKLSIQVESVFVGKIIPKKSTNVPHYFGQSNQPKPIYASHN